MRRRDEITEATLAWCNDRRTEQDKEPLADLPLGTQEDPTSCPCGAATGLYVDWDFYVVLDANGDKTEEVHELPHEVQDFVKYFDAGQYPEYNIDVRGRELNG